MVLGACWQTKRWRELASPAHLSGLALCLALVLTWAIPFIQRYEHLIDTQPWLAPVSMKGGATPAATEPPQGALAIWRHEIGSRVTGEEESSTKDWLVRGPRALTMFLPWILLLPFAWKRRVIESTFGHDQEMTRTIRGLWWGAAASFAFMVLLPSSSPRYVAPLLAPVAMLIGWNLVELHASAARANAVWRQIGFTVIAVGVLLLVTASFITFLPPGAVFPSGWQLGVLAAGCVAGVLGFRRTGDGSASRAVQNCFLTMTACAVLMTGYSWLAPSLSSRREDIRPTARSIAEAMQPKDARLYIFHLGQEPYAFYLPPDTLELYDLPQLPKSDVKWMLTTAKVDADFRPLFEKSYGPARKVGEWTGAWGASDQDVNRHMVLLRFGEK
jgi:hypothetical protein